MPPQSPRAILATLPVLASLTLMVSAVLLGVFGPVDRAVYGALGELWPDAPLSSEVAIVEIDEATVQRLGPPPWSAATWTGLRAALAEAGVEEAIVMEPPERLVDARVVALSQAPSPGARLLVPGADTAPPPLIARPEWALAWTDDAAGLGAAARSPGWCAWARCPVGLALQTPLRPEGLGTLRRVRLSELQAGRTRLMISDSTRIFLGFPTGSPWASTWPVGEPATQLSRTDAAALAVATLAARPPRPVLPLAVVVPLVALLVLGGALVAHLEPWLPAAAWILTLPALILGVCIALAMAGLALAPAVSLALAAVLGSIAEALRLHARMGAFFVRMGRKMARAEISLPRSADPSDQAMLQQLAALTWNHLPTDRMLYLRPRGRHVEVVGGFGVDVEQLVGPLTVARMDAMLGECDALIADADTRAALTAVRWHGRTVGWWLVAWSAALPGPSPTRMEDLARWATDAAPLPRPLGAVASLLRTDAQLDALELALDRRERASERQRELLERVPVPMAIADRSGAIVFQNEAFTAVTRGACPRSVRELVFRADGAEDLSYRMRAVFQVGQPLACVWEERQLRIVLSPAGEGARSGVLIRLDPLVEALAEGALVAK